MKSKIKYLFLLLILVLASCTKTEEKGIENENTEVSFYGETECIQSVNPIGVMPYGVDMQEIEVSQIPPKNWKMVGELPSSSWVYSFNIKDKSELWISYTDYETEPYDKLVKYNIQNNEKTFYSDDPSLNLPGHLFFSSNGTLWFVNNKIQNSDNVPFLSKYDPKSDSFEYVLDEEGLMQPPHELGWNPVEDYQGKLWLTIIEPDSGLEVLYRFDPDSLEIEKSNFQMPNNYSGFLLSTDKKSVWFIDFLNEELIQYNIESDTTNSFNTLPQRYPDEFLTDFSEFFGQADYIFFDESDRLWLGTEGWFDLADPDYPAFYELLPSSEFLEYDNIVQPSYSKSFITEVMESSDGYIWFMTMDGVNRLDIRGDDITT